jgi:putative phosphoribosyl transferase
MMRRFAEVFANRRAAGERLAAAVAKLRLRPPLVVLGLPRGGVPVAREVACALRAPLDVLPVRKVGAPGQPELALGAIAAGGVTVRQPAEGTLQLGTQEFAALAQRERTELERREQLYRTGLRPLELAGMTVVLVDDGLATGATMLAAVRAARQAHAASVVVAVPVGSNEAAALVGAESDELVVLEIPEFLRSVGEWYEDFAQVTDSEVCEILQQALASHEPTTRAGAQARGEP